MKLTLNKASRSLKQLQKELVTLEYKIRANAYIQIKYNKITNIDREETNILFEQDEFEIMLKNYHLIESDINNLKNAIDDKNNEVGINIILKNIDRVKKLLELYQELNIYTESQFLYPDMFIDTMKNDIEKMKESEEIKDKSVTVTKFKDKLLITKIVKQYKKELSNFEDVKFELNNSKSIDIDLNTISEELLGLSKE